MHPDVTTCSLHNLGSLGSLPLGLRVLAEGLGEPSQGGPVPLRGASPLRQRRTRHMPVRFPAQCCKHRMWA